MSFAGRAEYELKKVEDKVGSDRRREDSKKFAMNNRLNEAKSSLPLVKKKRVLPFPEEVQPITCT